MNLTSALWYLGRGTGVVALLMFTLTMLLGITTRSGRSALGLDRFGIADLHKTASLAGTGLIAVHVATLLFDPYAQLRLVDLVLPFAGSYRAVWLGLGTAALDVLLVVVATSLLRHRLGPRVFRGVHWAAYAMWPLALVHGLGTGTDAATWWFRVDRHRLRRRGHRRRRLAGLDRVRRARPGPRRPAPRHHLLERDHPMTVLDHVTAPVGTRRLFAAPGPGLHDHLATFGPLPERVDLPGLVEDAGLIGRGGAGFPSARKLRGVAERGRGVVVGNGVRGRADLRQGPHPADRRAAPGHRRPAAHRPGRRRHRGVPGHRPSRPGPAPARAGRAAPGAAADRGRRGRGRLRRPARSPRSSMR